MSNNENQTVAVIDSGMGGTSVLRQIIAKYGSGNYIYYADNLNMPYGNKDKLWLQNRVIEIINFLNTNYKPQYIIIACNTASTCVDSSLFKNVIPMQFNRKYTYFATSLTQKNLKGFNVIGDKTLAKQIEENIFDSKKMNLVVKNHVKCHNLNKLDSFVLGCTHYELVDFLFKKHCPKSDIINNSYFVLNDLKLNKTDELNLIILLSKNDLNFENKLRDLILKPTIVSSQS